MIIPMPMMNMGGGGKNTHLSVIIMSNIVLLFFLLFFVYQYNVDENYIESFWKWSWDMHYKYSEYHFCNWKKIDTYAGLASVFFWIPFFTINGITFIIWSSEKIEKLLDKKEKLL
jgi:hypothetical protein